MDKQKMSTDKDVMATEIEDSISFVLHLRVGAYPFKTMRNHYPPHPLAGQLVASIPDVPPSTQPHIQPHIRKYTHGSF